MEYESFMQEFIELDFVGRELLIETHGIKGVILWFLNKNVSQYEVCKIFLRISSNSNYLYMSKNFYLTWILGFKVRRFA